MGDIEVEAVESIDAPEGVDAPEYVLYGGKGGVGKTTMAAATALASARDGTPTLVVSTDPAHSLSDTLERSIPAEPTRIRDDVPLYAVEIDPDAAMEDGPFGLDADESPLGGLESLLDAGNDEEIRPFDPGAMPGADEAAAVRLLLEYLDDERFDRVVVDTAPTGHTLRLLELPEVMDSMVGRLLTVRQRLGNLMEGITGLFGGEDEEAPDAELDGLEGLRDRIERLRAALRDPGRTEFRVVMVPEEMSVVETERLLDRLEGFGIPAGTVVVNRVAQDIADVVDRNPERRSADDGTDRTADWLVSPNLESCEFCRRRWGVQQNALQRAQPVFRGREVKRVPLFADEVRGEEMLLVVAACLR